jgi:subtilisin family serine protease
MTQCLGVEQFRAFSPQVRKSVVTPKNVTTSSWRAYRRPMEAILWDGIRQAGPSISCVYFVLPIIAAFVRNDPMANPFRHQAGRLIILIAASLVCGFFFRPAPESDSGGAIIPAATSIAAKDAPAPPALTAAAEAIRANPAAKQPAALSPRPDKKPDPRLLEGDTVWASPIDKGADGRLHRVRLLQTQFHHSLLRVEEELSVKQDGNGPEITRQNAMVADHLLVKAAQGVDRARLDEALRPLGISIKQQFPGTELYLMSIPAQDGQSLPGAVQILGKLKDIISYAEPDYIVHATTAPNDTRYAEQWGLNNTGQTGGTADADIDAPEAWSLSTGSNSVVVAVLDSGMDHTHPDLAANVWTNPGEIAANGVDDDGNGYIDDVRGWNFLNGNNTTTDSNTHGTHVSGILGASGNNGAGISGVAWQVKLMPLKFLNSSGFGATSTAIAAINYARVKGAHIINHSWGVAAFSQPLKDAIDAAGAAGILNVCAADNGNGTNEDVTPNYPSGYASASVLAVANTTHTDALSSSSNYGPTSVHLGAPGSSILSTLPGGGYGLNSGTSMATPHVSGIAALLKAYKPALTGEDLKAILQSSVEVIPALTGRTSTGGRANAFRALGWVSDISVVPASGADFAGNQGGPFLPTSKVFTLKNHGSSSASWSAVLNNAYYASVSPASGTLAPGASVTLTVTLNTTLANNAAPGLYEGSLVVTNTTSGKNSTWPLRMDVRVPHLYSYDLNSDPGWSRDEAWQFGTPTGKGGSAGNGNADPTSGRTGANVFGVNLNGDFSATVNGQHSLTAGPFDLRGYTQTKLNFWRWLNTNSQFNYVPHGIQIRNESSETWTYLWSNNGYVHDNAWTEQTLALGANGDGRSAVYIRWSYEVTNANASPSSGWNIDDIKITGQPGKRLFLDGVAAANENSGTATLTLHVEPASPTDLTVTLASGDSTAATLPTTVIVPANTRSVSVQVALVDDALLDGTQTAVLTPVAAGFASIPWNLAVNDNETATLSLNTPATATEGGATLQGTVSLSAAAGRAVLVTLASSQPNAASVPAGITIPAGQTSAAFPITLPQNGIMENTKTAQISASVTNWPGATANISVTDDDYLPPTLSFAQNAGSFHLAEGQDTSAYVATVRLAAPRLVDTVITLSLNDNTEFTLPATVTIPAGKLVASISPVSVIDDSLQDGVQTVVVEASSPGLLTGSASVTVADNEVASFVFGYIPSPQTPGLPFYPGIQALDVDGRLAAGYNGTATVTALINGAPDAAFGNKTASFYQGSSADGFSVSAITSSYVLRVVAGAVTGTSNVFSTESGHVQTVSVTANELAYDSVTNRVYASTNNGTVVPIHPGTGATDAPITVGAGVVGQIEASTSGGILYAVVNNRTQIVKVDLVSRTVGTPFGFGVDMFGSALTVADFAILPNDNNTIGVVLNYASGTADRVAVYTNSVKRPTVISYNSSSSINPVNALQITAGGTANRFYASNGVTNASSATLYLLDVAASGVTLNRSYLEPGTLTNLTASGDLLADDTGRVFEGESGNSRGRIGDGTLASVFLDHATGRACQIMHTTPYYYDPYALSVFELNGFSETGRTVTTTAEPVTNTNHYPALPSRIVKAGARGVAYRTAGSVFLVKSYFLPDPAISEPDLAVQQITAPVAPEAGRPMSFNMLVRNNGNAAAANVVLTSDWTPGAVYLGSSTTQGGVTQNGTRLTVNLGSLAAGETATVCLQMTAASITNKATLTSPTPESFTQNNLSSQTCYPSANAQYFSTVLLKTADLASSKVTQRVYAPQGFGSGFFAGTLAVLDLAAPAVRAFVPVGSSPGTLALAENQTDLFIALDGSGQVLPFNLSTLAAGTPFTPGLAADGRRLWVKDMVSRPGSPGHVIISRQDATGGQAGVGLFVNGALVGSTTPPTEETHWLAVNPDGTACYSCGTAPDYSTTTLYRMNVSGAGLTMANARSSVLLGRRVGFGSGRVLAANGRMFDPNTLADTGFLENSSVYPYLTLLNTVHDPERERTYGMSESSTGVLRAYNSLNFQITAQKASGLSKGPDRMVRWGEHGLAMSSTALYANYAILWVNDADLVPDPPIRVSLPAFVMENAGLISGAGSVQLTVAPPTDLTVTLTSSNPVLLQAPATVTVPAGQTSATFNLTLTNDALLNGSRSVTLTPGGVAAYNLLPGVVEVRDDEVGTLALTLPSSVTEGAGLISGQSFITLTNGPAVADITVQLASDRTSKLTVPATVVIPAGQSTATFALTALDDEYLDGTQVVTVSASVGGWSTAVRSLNVQDNEATAINLGFGNSVSEGYGSYQTTLQLGGRVLQDTVVTLTSSRPDKIAVPASVTVPAGLYGATLNATIVENSLKDGRQTVTLTATVAGIASSTKDVVVIDNDLAVMQWSAIPNANAGDVIPVSVAGTTLDGDPVSVPFNYSVTATALRDGTPIPGFSVTLSQGGSTAYVGSIKMLQAGTNITLTTTLAGVTGVSNAFTISAGAMSSFVWDAVSGLPQPNIPFPVTVRAADGYGNLLPSFTGTAALSAFQGASTVTTSSIGTSALPTAMDTSKEQSRMMLVLASSWINRAGRLRSLSLEILTPPGRVFDSFLIRAKHTSNSNPTNWDNTGYTVLRQGPLDLTQTRGWVEIPFSTPFDYNGTSDLLLDISFSNSGTASGGSYLGAAPYYDSRFLGASASSAQGYGAPESWSGSSPYPSYVGMPNLRLSYGTALNVTPATTGAFTNGVWTGNVTLDQAASDVSLVATSGASLGKSSVFEVGAVPPAAPVLSSLPATSATTSRSLTWNAVATATDYYAEAATDNTFTNPVANSGWITATTHTFTGLTSGTRYYFRVKARKTALEGAWSSPVDTTMDAAGPVITLGNSDDGPVTAFTTVQSVWGIAGKVVDVPAGVSSLQIIVGGTTYNWAYNPDGTWAVGITLPPGTFAISFRATDSLGNITQRNVTITRKADTDANGLPDDWQTTHSLLLGGVNSTRTTDFDLDGRSNLLEYAFNTPANSGTVSLYPSATHEVKSADGQTYLVYRYDRRRGAVDLTYNIEFSSDLSSWSTTSFQTEPVGAPVLNPDGVTERVTTRVLPHVSQIPGLKVFVRLAVTSLVP